MPFVLLVSMLAAAVVLSMLGMGGGALYTPIQTWVGVGFHEAATTSLFLIMVTSLSSSIVYRKAKKIDVPLVIVLESVTMTGGFAGGIVSEELAGTVLGLLLAAALAFGAFFMIRSPKSGPIAWMQRPGWYAWRRQFGDRSYRVNMAVALPLSFLAGLVSGLLGVGGGIVKVPLMVLLLGVPMDIAVGSSALMVGLTAAGGFVGHVTVGHWNWQMSLVLAAVVFLGAQIGSRISVGLDEGRLKRIFGWFLLGVAVLMAVTSLR